MLCTPHLTDKGDVFGWGNSEYLQFNSVTSDEQLNIPRRLPISASIGKVLRASAGSSACAILNERNEVYVWGFGYLGKGPQTDHLKEPSLIPPPLFQCDDFNPDIRVVDIVAGLRHFAALTNQGDVYMWGKNRRACLGLGGGFKPENHKDQFFPLRVATSGGVLKVSLGVDHTLALCRSFD